MLVADVPHAEDGCRHGREHGDDHNALEIDCVPDVAALCGNRARNVKECLKSVHSGVQPVKFAAFFKYLVHTFKPFL